LAAPANTENKRGFLRIEVEVDGAHDPVHWLSHQHLHPQLYFADLDESHRVAGVGAAETVAISSGAWLSHGDLFAARVGTSRACYYGFARTDPTTDEMGSVRGQYVLPLFELQTHTGVSYFSCHLRWDPPGIAAPAVGRSHREAAMDALETLGLVCRSTEPVPRHVRERPMLLGRVPWVAAGQGVGGNCGGTGGAVKAAGGLDGGAGSTTSNTAVNSVTVTAAAVAAVGATGGGAETRCEGDTTRGHEGAHPPTRPKLAPVEKLHLSQPVDSLHVILWLGERDGAPAAVTSGETLRPNQHSDYKTASPGPQPRQILMIKPSDSNALLSTACSARTPSSARFDGISTDTERLAALFTGEPTQGVYVAHGLNPFDPDMLAATWGRASTGRICWFRPISTALFVGDTAYVYNNTPLARGEARGEESGVKARGEVGGKWSGAIPEGISEAAAIPEGGAPAPAPTVGDVGDTGDRGESTSDSIPADSLRLDSFFPTARRQHGAKPPPGISDAATSTPGAHSQSQLAHSQAQLVQSAENFNLSSSHSQSHSQQLERAENLNIVSTTILLEELRRCGLAHVVLCPGSRSAALAIALSRSSIPHTIALDERGAGFMALGMSRP